MDQIILVLAEVKGQAAGTSSNINRKRRKAKQQVNSVEPIPGRGRLRLRGGRLALSTWFRIDNVGPDETVSYIDDPPNDESEDNEAIPDDLIRGSYAKVLAYANRMEFAECVLTRRRYEYHAIGSVGYMNQRYLKIGEVNWDGSEVIMLEPVARRLAGAGEENIAKDIQDILLGHRSRNESDQKHVYMPNGIIIRPRSI